MQKEKKCAFAKREEGSRKLGQVKYKKEKTNGTRNSIIKALIAIIRKQKKRSL